ncbi:type II secretion system protein [uncultured Helicobacter sp.]|uniref:type II secretion system protein n=1 Tax=uncultured Helicobacter sp. TaxID=175537 RepID=UPI0026061C9A|nr:type II secretion system protein [uncultured Helicobacter sp.]
MKQKRAFTLLEVLLAVILLGVFGIFGSKLLLGIYQNYNLQNQNFQKQLEAQNALLQVKRLLESSYLESLQILPNVPISTTSTNLIGKSLIFYEKLEQFVLQEDFAIPCFHGVFDPKSLKIINSTLSLEFLKLSTNPNTTCPFGLPKTALLISENFISPQDFYNPNFQGRILHFNTDSITLEIPNALKQQPLNKISPKLYFLDSPTRLHFGNSLILEQNKNYITLVENLSHFSLKTHSLGFYVRLCLQNDYCASSVIVEL